MKSGPGYLGQVARRPDRSGKLQSQTFRRREKGLWTFLTWSFFLSQAIAADQAMGSLPQSAAAEDGAASRGELASDQLSRIPPALLQPVDFSAQVQDSASPATSALSPDIAAVQLVTLGPLQFAAAHAAEPVSMAVAPHASAVGSGTVVLLDEQPAVAPDIGLGGADIPVGAPIGGPIGDPIGGILHPIVDIVDSIIPPVAGIVDDVVEAVKPIVDQVVDGLVDPVLDLVIDQVASPILGAASNLLGDILSISGPAEMGATLAELGLDTTQSLGELLGSANETLASTIEPIAPLVTDLIGDVPAHLAATASSAVYDAFASGAGAVDGPLGKVTGLLGLSGGGSLEFASGTTDLPQYEIISGGTYTDYGLALQTGSSMVANQSAVLVDTAPDLVGGLLGSLADAPLSQSGPPAPLASAEDARGLLDGFAL